MPRTRARKQRSRKNRSRRGGDLNGSSYEYGTDAPASSPPLSPYSSPAPSPVSSTYSSPVASTYSSPVASASAGTYWDRFKKSLSWSGGKRKRRGGFKPYDPLQSTYGSGSAKGGRRRKSRKSRKSRR